MKRRLFLDIVITQGSSIFQLLSSKYQSLLIWWNSFFVLNFCFNIFNGIRSFNLKSYGFSSECLHKDLHSSSKAKNQMKRRLFLDIVITQGSSIFQLLSSKYQSLLIWWNSFFVLNFCFNIFNGIRSFNLKSYGLSSKCLHKDLHSSSKAKNQMKGRLFLNVVITQGSSIFQLLSSKNQSLLIWWNSFFVLNLSFNIFNGIRSFNTSNVMVFPVRVFTKICIFRLVLTL